MTSQTNLLDYFLACHTLTLVPISSCIMKNETQLEYPTEFVRVFILFENLFKPRQLHFA